MHMSSLLAVGVAVIAILNAMRTLRGKRKYADISDDPDRAIG